MDLFVKIVCTMGFCYLAVGLICSILKNTKNNLLQRISIAHESFFKKVITGLLVSLFVLNCIDAISTWYAISYLPAQEQNGIMGWMIEQGWGWFFSFKLITITLVVTELYLLYIKGIVIFKSKNRKKEIYALESIANTCVFVGLYVWVCTHNLSVIFGYLLTT